MPVRAAYEPLDLDEQGRAAKGNFHKMPQEIGTNKKNKIEEIKNVPKQKQKLKDVAIIYVGT